jgi:hypothetical protein
MEAYGSCLPVFVITAPPDARGFSLRNKPHQAPLIVARDQLIHICCMALESV